MHNGKGYPPVNAELHNYILANVLRATARASDIRHEQVSGICAVLDSHQYMAFTTRVNGKFLGQ
jgi:hypothetical protein